MNSATRYLFILLILPALFFVFGTYFDRAFYAGDPNYIYLMNGVNICMGQQVGNADNPGTPVMILSAVVLEVHHFISGADESIQLSVLKDPDHFIALLRFFFDGLNSLTLFFVGIAIFYFTRSIWSALIMQLTPFLSVNLLEHVWSKASPEPFLLFLALTFSLFIVKFIYDTNYNRSIYLLLFGILSGLGIATKLTFMPLVFIPLILLPRWNKKLIFIIISIISFVIFTLPAFHIYNKMFLWFKALFMHSGIYGNGETGIIDPSLYVKNLYLIVYNNPLFGIFLFLLMVLLALTFFVKRIKLLIPGDKTIQSLLALFISQLLGLLLVAKHYHANHYLVPVLSLAGLNLVIVFSFLEKSSIQLKKILLAKRIVFLVLVGIILVFNMPLLLIKDKGYQNTNKQYTEASRILKENYPDFFCIYNLPWGHNRFAAFRFGNDYCSHFHREALESLYPNKCFYDTRVKGFSEWYLPASFEDVLSNQGKKIVLSGFPLETEDLIILKNAGYPFNEILLGNTQALYLLDTTSLIFQERNMKVGKPLEIMVDMETTSVDGSKFVFQDNIIGGGNLQSSDVSRSGNYSIKLTENVEYAMDFNLSNFYPGSSVCSHIWRYPAGSKTNIVFSAENSAEFYILNTKSEETDENGWEKIELNFQNPLTENHIEKLKFYLWNSEQETVYFDDFYLIHK